ncbi:DUF4391 domain-containing protein [Methanimicrococcus stummii]|uniref:DUF4391 domain-containing protein n=1 Tax=Methanimicrococcus stummii TaxID=3028294 RepID=UPI00293155E6|nr:DUF4391 domain-containing protein [Methanimicrococcus sp. Es2]
MVTYSSDYLKILDYPPRCNISKDESLITKELVKQELKTTTERKVFNKDVKKVFCHFSLRENTVYIKPYQDDEREYSELLVIELYIYSSENTKKIAEMLMKVILYPVLLFFNNGEMIQLAAAHQRTNLSDDSKNVLEEIVLTEWFSLDSDFLNHLSLENLNKKDLYSLYSDYINRIHLHNAAQKKINPALFNNSESARDVLNKIQSIDDEIESLKSKIKNSGTSAAEQINLNIRIHKLKEEKEQYLTSTD